MIFFFDVNHAYAMAEATQSLSLENDEAHDEGDQLWLGHAKIPRNVACCEVTVNLPSFPATMSTLSGDRDSVFVVDDLTENLQTRDKPFVTGFPHGRFYAGVPITSSSGINIGAYCILDDKPRSGLSQKELTFLRDMSHTVVKHLESVRGQFERQRATHMVTGLGNFVKGSSALRRRRHTGHLTKRKSTSIDAEPSDLLVRSFPENSRQAVPGPTAREMPAASPHQKGLNEHEKATGVTETNLASSASDTIPQPNRSPVPSSPEQAPRRIKGRLSSTPRLPRQNTDSLMDVQSTYQRASDIMRASLSVDGVAFLDASVGTFGGLADAIDPTETTEASTYEDSESTPSQSRPHDPSRAGGASCRLLGWSESARHSECCASGQEQSKKVPESFLRSLLRRNPYGKIWVFDENGLTHSEDTVSSEDDGPRGQMSDDQSPGGFQERKRRQIRRRRDGEILAAMFPGARSVAIHGIRDITQRRWASGCVLWSFDPLRILTIETEMNFVTAFCDIIVGETRRLEIQMSDKAKSDFISSISHELRSPLHGILGSSEVLRDLKLDSTASALVDQVDSCGRTLLEIINHLLDFANLKNKRLQNGAVSSSRIGRDVSPTGRKLSAQGDLADLDLRVALDDLTEEVVETAVYSYSCRTATDVSSAVPLILDIDRSPGNDWCCKLASGGWKRVCINLINNSLKYTASGYINVSLKQKYRPGSRGQVDAILEVADSGKGMSKDFLENHLFRDFTQEDTLADGMGLGMNMVARIVSAMGGQVKVTSDQLGSGTRVTVTVPLESSPSALSEKPTSDHIQQSLHLSGNLQNTGLVVGVIEGPCASPPSAEIDHASKTTASVLAISSFEKSCRYLGLATQSGTWEACSTASINVATEEDFAARVKALQETLNCGSNEPSRSKPCIVICKSSLSAKFLRKNSGSPNLQSHIVAEYVALPCGKTAISRAIVSLLQRCEESRLAELAKQMKTNNLKAFNLPMRPKLTENVDDRAHVPVALEQEAVSPFSDIRNPPPQLHLDEALMKSPKSVLEAYSPQWGDSREKVEPESVCVQPTEPPKADKPVLLLVDDNKVNLRLLTMYAKKNNYEYITASDGQLAVNAYQKAHEDSSSDIQNETFAPEPKLPGRPSVVLMDINMPVMDGYEATQRIRAYERKHQLPASRIIALTALGSDAAHKEAFGSGCNMFLTKPVKLKDLTTVIERQEGP